MSSSVAMVIVANSISDETLGFSAVDAKTGGLFGSAGVSSTIGVASALSLQG